MRRFWRYVLYSTLGLASLWVFACVALIVKRHDLIYPFEAGISADRVAGVPRASATIIVAADGTPLTVWVVPPTYRQAIILFFMGNGGNLSANAERLAELAHQGYGIAALNYRGAGGAPGTPSQSAIVADAVALYDTRDTLFGAEIAAHQRVIYGTSLGAAVAVQLAARRPSDGVILGAPFARLCEAGQHHYPLIPVCWLLPDNRWDSLDLISQITVPVVILHGAADQVIPISQGEKLLSAANAPKQFVRYPLGRHSDLRLYGSGGDVLRWLEATLPPG